MFTIERCDFVDPRWIALRAELWPDLTLEQHQDDLAKLRVIDSRPLVGFLATENGRAIGFAEAALRRAGVNGCDTLNVAFLEGIWVQPAHRRRGIARALIQATEKWARKIGCTEFGSDALLENVEGHRMHVALGFQETERVVYFRKRLT
jgi:aminoglycoside 6'-N-acetyltransferase I